MNDLISRQDAIDLVEKWFLKIGLNGDICLDGLRSLPSAQKWIPCSEKLPEKDGRYLCTFKDIFYGEKIWLISVCLMTGNGLLTHLHGCHYHNRGKRWMVRNEFYNRNA